MTQSHMSEEDFRINALVRRLLARCWIDTELLRFGAAGGAVYFHGTFRRLRAPDGDASDGGEPHPEHDSEHVVLLDQIERELRADPIVTDVVFRLDNFRRLDGRWTVAEKKA